MIGASDCQRHFLDLPNNQTLSVLSVHTVDYHCQTLFVLSVHTVDYHCQTLSVLSVHTVDYHEKHMISQIGCGRLIPYSVIYSIYCYTVIV